MDIVSPFESETIEAAHFLRAFDASPKSCFMDNATAACEGKTVSGPSAHVNAAQHPRLFATTVDAQPILAWPGSILILVTGNCGNGKLFSQAFHLVPGPRCVLHYAFRTSSANNFNVVPEAMSVSKSFIEHYYTTYDSANRAALAGLYRLNSCCTFESEGCVGVASISQKLMSLPRARHDAASLTADVIQMSGNAMLLVFITGRLQLDGELNPLGFTEAFVLVRDGASFYACNQIFKFKYG